MSKQGNINKDNFLGMPFGTAQNRLRKMALFALLEKHGENICFRCSNKIETADELSLEHKKAWLNVSKELFWDLNNIAFSHVHCNCSTFVRVFSDEVHIQLKQQASTKKRINGKFVRE